MHRCGESQYWLSVLTGPTGSNCHVGEPVLTWACMTRHLPPLRPHSSPLNSFFAFSPYHANTSIVERGGSGRSNAPVDPGMTLYGPPSPRTIERLRGDCQRINHRRSPTWSPSHAHIIWAPPCLRQRHPWRIISRPRILAPPGRVVRLRRTEAVVDRCSTAYPLCRVIQALCCSPGQTRRLSCRMAASLVRDSGSSRGHGGGKSRELTKPAVAAVSLASNRDRCRRSHLAPVYLLAIMRFRPSSPAGLASWSHPLKGRAGSTAARIHGKHW